MTLNKYSYLLSSFTGYHLLKYSYFTLFAPKHAINYHNYTNYSKITQEIYIFIPTVSKKYTFNEQTHYTYLCCIRLFLQHFYFSLSAVLHNLSADCLQAFFISIHDHICCCFVFRTSFIQKLFNIFHIHISFQQRTVMRIFHSFIHCFC